MRLVCSELHNPSLETRPVSDRPTLGAIAPSGWAAVRLAASPFDFPIPLLLTPSYIYLFFFICLFLSSVDRAIIGSARRAGSNFVLVLGDPCNGLSPAWASCCPGINRSADRSAALSSVGFSLLYIRSLRSARTDSVLYCTPSVQI